MRSSRRTWSALSEREALTSRIRSHANILCPRQSVWMTPRLIQKAESNWAVPRDLPIGLAKGKGSVAAEAGFYSDYLADIGALIVVQRDVGLLLHPAVGVGEDAPRPAGFEAEAVLVEDRVAHHPEVFAG